MRFAAFLLLTVSVALCGENNIFSSSMDTVHVQAGYFIQFSDSIIYLNNDTTLILPEATEYTILDSSYVKSKAFYDSLKAKSKDSKWLNMLYEAVISTPEKNLSETAGFVHGTDRFIPFSGKIIGSIHLNKVDILEGSVNDTTRKVQSSIGRALNSVHINTRDYVIFNNLFFESGDSLNPGLLSDNERILRELPFIRDARIRVKTRPDTSIVDIIVITQDVFSIGADLGVNSVDDFKIKLFDKNFLGYGHDLRMGILYNAELNPKTGFETSYGINNIAGTFISAEFEYIHKADLEMGRISFSRAFLTPQTKYAGGLDLSWTTDYREVRLSDSSEVLVKNPYTYAYYDLWAGRQFMLSDEWERQTIVVAGRISRKKFSLRPQVYPDSLLFFQNEDIVLGSISLKNIDYYQGSLIRGFGDIEDVPVGYWLQITSGLKYGQFKTKPYYGGEVVAAGIFNSIGFIGADVEIGGFYNGKVFDEGALRVSALQFTPLIKLGSYRLRNFLAVNYMIGIDQNKERIIYFIERNGIRGFPTLNYGGQQRFVVNWEAVTFTPWYFYGFKFAVFAFADMGFIGSSHNLPISNEMYSGLGFGLRVRNESLVFDTIQLRFGYFPRTAPGASHYDFNFSTSDPELFKKFSLHKPRIISFR